MDYGIEGRIVLPKFFVVSWPVADVERRCVINVVDKLQRCGKHRSRVIDSSAGVSSQGLTAER